MNVGDDRQRRALLDLDHRLRRFLCGNSDPDDPAVRVLEAGDLVERRLDVTRVRLGHGLGHDLGGTADDHVTDTNRNRLAAGSYCLLSPQPYFSPIRSKQTKEPRPPRAPPAPEP